MTLGSNLIKLALMWMIAREAILESMARRCAESGTPSRLIR